MAKVTIEFDTVDKKTSVKMNGAEMPNIDSVSIYKDCYGENESEGPKFRLSICQSAKSVEDKIRVTYMTNASDGSLVEDKIKSTSQEIKNLLGK